MPDLKPEIKDYWELPRFGKVKYNPFTIELAMYSRGMDEFDLAGATGFGIPVIQDLIAGKIEATADQAMRIGFILQYPITFFEQWFETQVVFGPVNGRQIKIDYSKYRIMMYEAPVPAEISLVPKGQLKFNF